MIRVHREEDFFKAPAGHFLAVGSLVYWCVDARLWGVTLRGPIDDEAVRQFVAWAEEEHRHPGAPYASLVDLRRVEVLHGDAFARLEAWYVATRERQRMRVNRLAFVRPVGGLPGMVVAGLPSIVAPRVPFQVTADLESALVWLGRVDAPALAERLEALAADTVREPPLITTLRRLLGATPDAPREALSRALGVSARTLQRRLQEAGTSLEQETARARVRLAQRLLLETDDKLGAVAAAAGFSTQSHFNATFRKLTGLSPGAWRADARRAEGPGGTGGEGKDGR